MRGKKEDKQNEYIVKRKEEILKSFKNLSADKRVIILPLINEFVFIESELKRLRSLPMLQIKESNPARQQITPAGKLYKEYMQSYINALKVLQKTLYIENVDGESELVKMLKEFDND